jgi:hypothetical protein
MVPPFERGSRGRKCRTAGKQQFDSLTVALPNAYEVS